ncbi:hypothetical protein IQ216_05485 [Cyanobium sp. LEGE 06143]|nr:hypothetical protein [Cyanobium sp. LEGE 06143]MBE9172556.1 hypothetical protein [Cyanobium sp. LEGE 06143]
MAPAILHRPAGRAAAPSSTRSAHAAQLLLRPPAAREQARLRGLVLR